MRRSAGPLLAVAAGVIIGAVEALVVISLAAIVFTGRVVGYVADGIGLFLVAAAVALALFAWRAGRRGVVGGLQEAVAAVLAVVAPGVALTTFGSPERALLTVVAATLVVTILCGIVFWALGTRRIGNVIRFIPYPVVGGFLAGAGWLLVKGGIYVASGADPSWAPIGDLVSDYELLIRWLPALAFGVVLLAAVRIIRRPLVIPAVIAIGLAVFVVGVVASGSGLEEARAGRWLLGPFTSTRLWQPWTLRALSGADWSAVLSQWAGIATAIFVATLAILFNISGTELVLDKDLDTNRELRDAGVLNVVSGALGGIPGYHALSLSSLANRMGVDARAAGLVAAAVPLAAVIFGAAVIELIPRMIVGGVLVFIGLAFIVEWVWDTRRTLPKIEYAVVLVILAGIIIRGFLPGVVLGLVASVVLFAISYGRVELVSEVAFAEPYRSNVDRPRTERAALRVVAGQVQILRVHGFVFFGSANNLLERIRARVDAGGLRFLVIDLQRASGVDASAVVALAKVVRLCEAAGAQLALTGASEAVRARLARGGLAERQGLVGFEPDLDRGLQRVEDALLAEIPAERAADQGAAGQGPGAPDGMPPHLEPYLERVSLGEGEVLIHQAAAPADVFVLESGRLRVQMQTPEGRKIRLRTLRPGVVVGEIALYTGAARTADVVAETPAVVLRLSEDAIERIGADDPALAASLHRWLATTLALRLNDTLGTMDELLD